jgi:hypothetical protein
MKFSPFPGFQARFCEIASRGNPEHRAKSFRIYGRRLRDKCRSTIPRQSNQELRNQLSPMGHEFVPIENDWQQIS